MADYIVDCSSILIAVFFTVTLLGGLKEYRILFGYVAAAIILVILSGYVYWFAPGRLDSIIYYTELIHIPFYLGLLWKRRRKLIDLRKNITSIESRLFTIAVLAGICAIMFCFWKNKRYVYPRTVEEHIGNFYFNADTWRCIAYAFSDRLPHQNHPSYRFVLNMFLLPCKLLFRILGYQSLTLGGYYIAFLQVLWNGISVILLYKLVKENVRHGSAAVFAAGLYLVSAAYLWAAILPETWSLSVCIGLLALYLFNRQCPLAEAAAVLAVGMNPVMGCMFLPCLFMRWKSFLQRHIKSLMICMGAMLLLVSIIGQKYIDMIMLYHTGIGNWWQRLYMLWGNLVTAGFWGPVEVYAPPFFVQLTGKPYAALLLLMFIVIMMLPLCRCKKPILFWSALFQLAAAGLLHGVIGFGLKYAFIYSPLYIPAIIILVSLGTDHYDKAAMRNTMIGIMFVITACSSVKWLSGFGNELRKIVIPIENWHRPSGEFQLGNTKLMLEGSVLKENSNAILADVDSIMISNRGDNMIIIQRDGTVWTFTAEDTLTVGQIQ